LRSKTPKLNEVEPNAYKTPRQLARHLACQLATPWGEEVHLKPTQLLIALSCSFLPFPFYHKFSKSKIAAGGRQTSERRYRSERISAPSEGRQNANAERM
jgi:hypothetical protein